MPLKILLATSGNVLRGADLDAPQPRTGGMRINRSSKISAIGCAVAIACVAAVAVSSGDSRSDVEPQIAPSTERAIDRLAAVFESRLVRERPTSVNLGRSQNGRELPARARVDLGGPTAPKVLVIGCAATTNCPGSEIAEMADVGCPAPDLAGSIVVPTLGPNPSYADTLASALESKLRPDVTIRFQEGPRTVVSGAGGPRGPAASYARKARVPFQPLDDETPPSVIVVDVASHHGPQIVQRLTVAVWSFGGDLGSRHHLIRTQTPAGGTA